MYMYTAGFTQLTNHLILKYIKDGHPGHVNNLKQLLDPNYQLYAKYSYLIAVQFQLS